MNETPLFPNGPKLQEHQERPRKGRKAKAGNPTADHPELERCAAITAMGQGFTEGANRQRYLVRVTSFRRRLIDEDNLCEKFAVDCCRNAGVLPDDAPGTTKIEVTQQKVSEEAQERTLIEIFEKE
jgi:hypothetical protein